MMEILYSIPLWVWVIILLWELTWKAIAMWHAARRNQLSWFVVLLILNTVGILPIVYLLSNRKKNS